MSPETRGYAAYPGATSKGIPTPSSNYSKISAPIWNPEISPRHVHFQPLKLEMNEMRPPIQNSPIVTKGRLAFVLSYLAVLQY